MPLLLYFTHYEIFLQNFQNKMWILRYLTKAFAAPLAYTK